MSSGRKNQRPIRRHGWRGIRSWPAAIFGFAAICIIPTASAQQASTTVYVAGNAALTGFSGIQPPVQIAPGVDPNQKTFIDLNGPALRVVDLQHMGGPTAAQLVGAPKPFTFSAEQLGQVFGVALDDNSPPNIYAAASSAYGLPIIAPGPDGQPLHIPAGAPNATFMPGLWGPQGGPGSIWKIDGVTGAVSLFANVATNGRGNSGAALGGLVYDPDSKSLYVADRESGLIHRFWLNGRDLGTYDHGVTGRAAQGLPPEPWTSQQPINIASPQFDSAQPATWNYAAHERRIFGLAVHDRRLYYAVADSLQIWSVGLNADGSFANDAVIELAAPPSSGPTEISKITFDEQGRMFLADRPAPTGAFDFEALAVPAIGRVLRYALIEIMPNGRRIWQQQPDEYAIGFPPDFHNGNGGVAIGYNYDHNGEILPGSCGGFMWTTGEDLRHPADAALAARLDQSGPLDVNGLQGNGTWRIRRGDAPPLYSYFIDYADEYDDPAERGHMGDVAIERLCSPAQRADLIPYGGAPPAGPPRGGPPQGGNPPGPPNIPGPPPNTPPGGCQPGQLRRAGTNECGSCPAPGVQINGTCCSVTQIAATAACSNSSCPAGQTPIGPSNFCCNSNQVYTGAGGVAACCIGPLVNGKCPTPPPPPKSTCQNGYVPIGNTCCLASKVTSTGVCCPAGQTPGGPNKSQCGKIVLKPIKPPPGPQCCAPGKIPTASGICCLPGNVTTSGVCCPGPVDPTNRKECRVLIPLASCASGYTKMPNGSCCNNRYVSEDGKSCRSGQSSTPLVPLVPLVPRACPPGTVRDRNGDCVRRRPPACAPGEIRMSNGECVRRGRPPCPPGMVRNPRGICIRVGPPPRFGGPRRFGPPIGAPRPGLLR
jgi:hypothetical protein